MLRVTHLDGQLQPPAGSFTVAAAVRSAGRPRQPSNTAVAVEITLAPGGQSAPGLGTLDPPAGVVGDTRWTGGAGIGRTLCSVPQLLATNAVPGAIAAQLNNLLRQLGEYDPLGLKELVAILSSDDPPAEATIGGIHVRLIGMGQRVDALLEQTEGSRASGIDDPEEVERRTGPGPMRMFNTRTRFEFDITPWRST